MSVFSKKSAEQKFEAKVAKKDYYTALGIALQEKLSDEFIIKAVSSAYNRMMQDGIEKDASMLIDVFKDYLEEIDVANKKQIDIKEQMKIITRRSEQNRSEQNRTEPLSLLSRCYLHKAL